jgi:hypothetical protein
MIFLLSIWKKKKEIILTFILINQLLVDSVIIDTEVIREDHIYRPRQHNITIHDPLNSF